MRIRQLTIAALAFLGPLSVSTARGDNYGLRLVGRAVPGEATASFVTPNRCYLGAGNCLQVYDTTNPSATFLLGQLPLSGLVEDVFVRDNFAYVADGAGGLVVADITSPSDMRERGQLAVADEAFGIAVQGNYAYVASLLGGFLVVDISNPDAPSLVGSMPVEWAALNVAVEGNLAAVACGYGGLYLIDVSDPAAPVWLGLLDQQGTWAYDVKMDGSYAYMAYSLEGGGGGLKVVNISYPAVPQTAGDLMTSLELRRIDSSGGYVFAAAATGGTFVIDARTVTWPHIIGGSASRYGENISYSAGRIFLCGAKDGLSIFDASQLNNPVLLSTYPTYSASQDVAVAGPWAYVVEQPAGLKAIHIADPAAPQVTYSRRFYWQNGGYRGVSSGVSVAGDRLFVSDFADMEGGQHDFRAYGLANPASPESLSVLRNLEAGIRGHRVRNNTAYLSNSWQLKVLDVSNPRNMVPVYDLIGGWDFAYGMDLSGNSLYLGTMETGLRVLDLSNERYPVVVGSFDTAGQTFTAKYRAGHAYLPDYDQGLRIVNIENLAAPYEVGHFNAYPYCLDVAFLDTADGAYAVAAFDDAIAVVDIQDPANPVEVGYYATGDPRRLCVVGETIYVADRISGLYLFALNGPPTAAEGDGRWHRDGNLSLRSYPNPSRRSATLDFDLADRGRVSVEVFDVSGRKVAEVFSGSLEAGRNKLTWDGRDSLHREVSPGIYFYRLTTDERTTTGRMTIVR